MTGNPSANPIYPRYRLDQQRFRIGAQRELTAEITDPDGQIWEMLNLLDGSRTLQQVIDLMLDAHPGLVEQDIRDCMETLNSEGFLTDSGPSEFDKDPKLRRYIGNVNFFSHFRDVNASRGNDQAKLLKTRVALLGLGGGGSTVLQLLGAIGVGHIRAVDKDVIEASNLNRQLIYSPADIGRPKAEAATTALHRMNPDIEIELRVGELTSVADVLEVIEGADIVICAVDEPRLIIQRIVNRACIQVGIPCVYGVYQVTRGRVFSIMPGQGGCFDCLHLYYTERDPQFVTQFDSIRNSGFKSPPLAYAPNVAGLCSQMVDEMVRIVTGYLAPRSVSSQLEIDFDEATTTKLLTWPRYEDRCPTCGNGSEEELASLLRVSPLEPGFKAQ